MIFVSRRSGARFAFEALSPLLCQPALPIEAICCPNCGALKRARNDQKSSCITKQWRSAWKASQQGRLRAGDRAGQKEVGNALKTDGA